MLSDDERGFTDAIARLHAWMERGDYREPTPLMDELEALHRIEEAHRQRLGRDERGDERYFGIRNECGDGRTVGGLVYVRGIAHHNAEFGRAVIDGTRPFTLGRSSVGGLDALAGQGVRLTWPPLAELPPPDRPEKKHKRDEMYDKHVAERDVLQTFATTRVFFGMVAGIS